MDVLDETKEIMKIAKGCIGLVISSIILKSYLGITTQKRDFIIILCSLNLGFCSYHLWEVNYLEKVFRLENKNIIQFGKRVGVVTLLYILHISIFGSLFFTKMHNLEMIIVILIFIMEALVIAFLIKEVYDLVFLEESRRDFEIEKNRKRYIENE